MAFSSPFFFKIFPINQKDIEIWNRMQSRLIESLPRQTIFSPFDFLTLTSKNSNGSMVSRRNKRSYEKSLNNYSESNINELEINKNSQINNNAQENFTTNILKKKNRESVYRHEDREFCAADKCLRPYS